MPENIHDKGYKRLLSKKRNFMSLLKSFVREEWIIDINEDSLELIDKEFIPKDFKEKEADIIYRLSVGDKDIIFYCLLELQSSVDHTIPFRLLIYMVELLKRLFMDIDERTRENSMYRFPAVVPLVLYNGKDQWTTVKSFKEYFVNYEIFGDRIIDFEYILLNVNQYTNDSLQEVSNLISSVLSLDKKQTAESFIANLKMAANVITGLTTDEQVDFMYWLKDVLTQKAGIDKKKLVEEMLNNLAKGEVGRMTYAVERLFDEIEEKGIEKGIERGVEQGIEQGIVQGIERGIEQGMALLLIEMLSERFGYLSPDIQAKLQCLEDNKIKKNARNIFYIQDLNELDKWFV